MSSASEVIAQLDSERDALRRVRLKEMQRMAVGLLLAMVGLYILALAQRDASPAWGFVAAFAEAAMVGAIADWFAVVALFRHPLGIPIWHTAIIQNSKDDIGRNLGQFVENHFITEEAVAQRLAAVDPARLLSAWLLAPNTAPKLGHTLAKAAAKLLEALDDEPIGRLLRETVSRQLSRLDLSNSAGKLADLLVAGRRHQDLLDGILQGIVDYLANENKRPLLTEFLIEAFRIDQAVYKFAVRHYAPKAMNSLSQSVVNVQGDAEHPLRKKFDAWVRTFVLQLKADPDWHDSLARCQSEVLASPQVEAVLDSLWHRIRRRLQADLARDDPVLGGQLAALVRKIGETLSADAGLRAWLNQAIDSGSAGLIRKYRGEVAMFIETHLAQWSQAEMTQRIELAIGRDLQFIRINGTLVGGLVGVAIYSFTYLTQHPW